VRVTGDDYARLGEAAERLTHFVGNRCYMRMTGERCAALSITPSGEFVCSVYQHRPQICRDLSRGGPECEAERQQKAERASARLRVLQGL
jgi:Fe-S-cluster containining protein